MIAIRILELSRLLESCKITPRRDRSGCQYNQVLKWWSRIGIGGMRLKENDEFPVLASDTTLYRGWPTLTRPTSRQEPELSSRVSNNSLKVLFASQPTCWQKSSEGRNASKSLPKANGVIPSPEISNKLWVDSTALLHLPWVNSSTLAGPDILVL